MREIDQHNPFGIKRKDLTTLFRQVSQSAMSPAVKSNRKESYALESVEIIAKHNKLRMTACDARQFSTAYLHTDGDHFNKEPDFTCHVPRNALRMAVNAFSGVDDLWLYVAKSHVTNGDVLHITDKYSNVETPITLQPFPCWDRIIKETDDRLNWVVIEPRKILLQLECNFDGINVKLLPKHKRHMIIRIDSGGIHLYPSKMLQHAANTAIDKLKESGQFSEWENKSHITLGRIANGMGWSTKKDTSNDDFVYMIWISAARLMSVLKTIPDKEILLGYSISNYPEIMTVYKGKEFEVRNNLAICKRGYRTKLLESPYLHIIQPERGS